MSSISFNLPHKNDDCGAWHCTLRQIAGTSDTVFKYSRYTKVTNKNTSMINNNRFKYFQIIINFVNLIICIL